MQFEADRVDEINLENTATHFALVKVLMEKHDINNATRISTLMSLVLPSELCY